MKQIAKSSFQELVDHKFTIDNRIDVRYPCDTICNIGVADASTQS